MTSKNYSPNHNVSNSIEDVPMLDQSFPLERTRIVVILDESGSMKPSQTQVITALNTFIDHQKSTQEDCLLTIIKFDTQVNPLWEDIPLSRAPILTEEHYNPDQGFTALYDAIGYAFQQFRNEKNVIIVILTDGLENVSQTHTAEAIKNNILTHKAPSEHNWNFIYLADSPDLLLQGQNIGIDRSSSSSIASVPFSRLTTEALNLSRQVSMYRSTPNQ